MSEYVYNEDLVFDMIACKSGCLVFPDFDVDVRYYGLRFSERNNVRVRLVSHDPVGIWESRVVFERGYSLETFAKLLRSRIESKEQLDVESKTIQYQ